jgi:hypothetical protein
LNLSLVHFLDRPVQPLIGFLAQPLLDQLIKMPQIFELAVAHEEVLFDVAHHALILALGAGAPWPAGARLKAVVGSQL